MAFYYYIIVKSPVGDALDLREIVSNSRKPIMTPTSGSRRIIPLFDGQNLICLRSVRLLFPPITIVAAFLVSGKKLTLQSRRSGQDNVDFCLHLASYQYDQVEVASFNPRPQARILVRNPSTDCIDPAVCHRYMLK